MVRQGEPLSSGPATERRSTGTGREVGDIRKNTENRRSLEEGEAALMAKRRTERRSHRRPVNDWPSARRASEGSR